MNKRYLILALIIVVLGFGMLFMPSSEKGKQIQPELLLAAIDDPSRFLSTDDITDKLVKKDPALLLIDVRPSSQFTVFAIPDALNIPVDSLLSKSAAELLGQKEKDKVFYSNSDVTSDEAWIICKRLGMKRIYVMQGGINKWFSTIVNTPKPAETESAEALKLYQFRIAASMHFFGKKDLVNAINSGTDKKKVNVVKKPASAASGGGC